MIELKHLSKTFKTKTEVTHAVQNLNLTIEQGEIFGIIGYSGAGKSTLLRLINLLEQPTEGTIWVQGREITHLKAKELRTLRQKMGMIFQHFNLLWSKTVYQNIAFPLEIAHVKKEKRDERVKELIQLVGLNGKEHSYPAQLSGGQKQRVGIARALANEPEILLCDEATSALDPETTDSILDLLQSIHQQLGLTIVVITHEMLVIKKICDRVAVMEAGKIVEIGKVLDLFAQPQETITQKFVGQLMAMDPTVLTKVKHANPNGQFIHVKYRNDNFEQPLIFNIMKPFEVEVNIIHGLVEQTHNGSYGSLILHLTGKEHEQAINELKHYTEVEVLKDAAIS